MKCGNCGHSPMEYRNQKDRASFPYKSHKSVLITVDLNLLECSKCGNIGMKLTEAKLVDEAIEKSLKKTADEKAFQEKLEWLKQWGSFKTSEEVRIYPWCMVDVMAIMDDYLDHRHAEIEKKKSELISKIEYHKKHYSVEIFPNSVKLDENSTRESIAAHMGRHMCDCILKYIEEIFPTKRSEG
jgi:DNA-directed RNA polymerase subunit M/transcription elongation factor TFIIS